jgi:hypothetical protein
MAGFIFVTVGSGNAHAEVWRCSVAGLATDFARVRHKLSHPRLPNTYVEAGPDGAKKSEDETMANETNLTPEQMATRIAVGGSPGQGRQP